MPKVAGGYKKQVGIKLEDGTGIVIVIAGQCNDLLSVNPDRLPLAKCQIGSRLEFDIWSEFGEVSDLKVKSDIIDLKSIEKVEGKYKAIAVVSVEPSLKNSEIVFSALVGVEPASASVFVRHNAALGVLPKTLELSEAAVTFNLIVFGDEELIGSLEKNAWRLVDRNQNEVVVEVVSESGRAIKIAADCLLVKEKLKETPIHLFNGTQKISTLDITYLTRESK